MVVKHLILFHISLKNSILVPTQGYLLQFSITHGQLTQQMDRHVPFLAMNLHLSSVILILARYGRYKLTDLRMHMQLHILYHLVIFMLGPGI